MLRRVVVVGSSLAGLRACETLRNEGFDGQITLVGAEAEFPYDRPPLSKKVLSGELDIERIRLRKAEDFAALTLDLRLGNPAVALRMDTRAVTLDDGDELAFDGLVIATGAAPRRLPDQPELGGVVELRTLADSMALRDRIADGSARVTVIGAGFIGLEVAATARQLGCKVTVLEGAPAPLIRGLGAEMGAAVAAVHTRHGVDLRCGVSVERIEGDGTRVTAVRLANGEVVDSDVVVVGVGVAPTTQWLSASGVALRDGVVCDATLNAGFPGVYAAGDCARWPNGVFAGFDDEEMRVEHWTNAAEQGVAAAHNMLAAARDEPSQPYESVPFFWSDQFESRMQFVGRAHGDDEVHVFAGDVAGEDGFAALYGYGDRLRGVLGVNMPKLVMPFRALIAAKASWSEALSKAAAIAP